MKVSSTRALEARDKLVNPREIYILSDIAKAEGKKTQDTVN